MRARENKEKGPRQKVSPFSGPSQRRIIVCFEMGVPYFKVRSIGILPPSSRTWKRETGGGERELEIMGFHSPLQLRDEMWASVWMSVQKASGGSCPGARLGVLARSEGGGRRRWARERSPPC